MSSQNSTKNSTVEIDNDSMLDTPIPKGLNLPSADKPANKPESNVALDEMVEALEEDIEQAMKEMQAVWEEIAIENRLLYTIQEWI
ncbi:hypothetical protein ACLX1H_009811 [Fusarium chlamydosporum]